MAVMLKLQKIYESMLQEKAASISDLESNKIALLTNKLPGMLQLILYEPDEWMIMKDEESIHSIVGFLEIEDWSQDCGLWEVARVAAKKGYGPILYDLAMSIIHPEPLASDDDISDQAKNIWNYMYKRRSGDYEMIERDDEGSKWTDPDDSCSPFEETGPESLIYSYVIKSPLSYSQLKKNHQELVHELGKEVEKKIAAAGEQFFYGKYGV